MPTNKSSVHQFRALRELEAALAGQRKQGVARKRYAATPQGQTIVPDQVGAKTSMGIDKGEVDHFVNHWLNGDYFPNIGRETIRERLEDGFGAALEEAGSCRLPVIPLWVRGSEDPESTDFRVDHIVTQHAVVVLMITPQPKR